MLKIHSNTKITNEYPNRVNIHCSPIWNVSLVAIILSLLIVFPLEFKEGSHGSSEVTSYNSSEGTELNSPDGPSSIMGEGKMEKDFQLAINYYSKVR